jgi:hypothetical protein
MGRLIMNNPQPSIAPSLPHIHKFRHSPLNSLNFISPKKTEKEKTAPTDQSQREENPRKINGVVLFFVVFKSWRIVHRKPN